MNGNLMLDQIEQIASAWRFSSSHLCSFLPLPPTPACYARVCLAQKSLYTEPTKINLYILGMCW